MTNPSDPRSEPRVEYITVHRRDIEWLRNIEVVLGARNSTDNCKQAAQTLHAHVERLLAAPAVGEDSRPESAKEKTERDVTEWGKSMRDSAESRRVTNFND